MLSTEEKIVKSLISQEEQLLENRIRDNGSVVSEFIEDNCVEIKPSGKISKYSSNKILGKLRGQSFIDYNSVESMNISKDCRLLIYDSLNVTQNKRMKFRNSSIWKKTGSKWKIVFHQETTCESKE